MLFGTVVVSVWALMWWQLLSNSTVIYWRTERPTGPHHHQDLGSNTTETLSNTWAFWTLAYLECPVSGVCTFGTLYWFYCNRQAQPRTDKVFEGISNSIWTQVWSSFCSYYNTKDDFQMAGQGHDTGARHSVSSTNRQCATVAGLGQVQ
jgi:hypothetical protein